MIIPVTRPVFPSLEDYHNELKDIWESGTLTNHGAKVQKLESDLRQFLKVPHLFLVTNGTIAIQLALKVLNIKGKVLTSPFSFVATTSSIVWENLEPCFVDIKASDLTISEELVEDRLKKDPNVGAILATHVYGSPCAIDALDFLSKKYGIPVIYDAAHAFSVEVNGRSILEYGTLSTLSFHATKVFHTIEGGAVVSSSSEFMRKLRLLGNFGHLSPESFECAGINAKISEVHAAMGLCLLNRVGEFIEKRQKLSLIYDQILFSRELPLAKPISNLEYTRNYAYYPIIFETEQALLDTRSHLADEGITTRRYFHPSLNKLPYVPSERCPISEDVSCRVLCLPLYPDLPMAEAERIGTEVRKIIAR